MWRRNNFQANRDSDHSISDEEEIEFHCSERCISLDGPSRRVEPNLALQFDLLTGGIKMKEMRKHMAVKRSKDENDYVGSANLTSLSKIQGKQKRQPLNFERIPFTEAEEDLDSEEAPPLPTSEYHSLEKDPANPVPNIIRELEDSGSGKAFGGHESSKSSMADLLDGLQEKRCGSHAIPRRVRKRGGKRKVGVRHTSLVNKSTSDDEDPCEIIDNGSSSDDVCKDKSIVLATTEPKRKTMADQFQEALGATSVYEHRPLLMPKQSRSCANGLLEKLQSVIQREKEHSMDFMQNLRSETLADEAGYIDVELLSRSFEAKMTVCLCSINCYKKGSVIIEKFKEIPIHTRIRIIFTSRTCGDVELDAGTGVRIYPPWKEVQVLGGDIVILASYFTQTLT